jgi:hypothetical protein
MNAPCLKMLSCSPYSPVDVKKVEILFAHPKRILKLDRLRLRGPNGAYDEFLLAAIARNLRRMAKWLSLVAPRVNLMTTGRRAEQKAQRKNPALSHQCPFHRNAAADRSGVEYFNGIGRKRSFIAARSASAA